MCACSVMSNSLQLHGYSLPGSSVHGIFQARKLGVGCHFLLQGILPTQGLNLQLLHFFHSRGFFTTEPHESKKKKR